MYGWFFLSVLAGLLSNGFHAINRHGLKKYHDPSGFGWWFEALKVLVFGTYLIFVGVGTLSLKAIGVLTALGVIEIASVFAFMRMHAYTDLSISSILSRLRLVWVPIIAFILLGEKLTFISYVAIGIIFLGLSIVVSPKKIRKDKGILFTLMFSVISALISIFMKWSAELASTPVLMTAMALPGVIVMPFFMKDAGKRIITTAKKQPWHILGSGAFNMSAMAITVQAYRLGSAGKVVAVYQSMMIASVLVGIFIFGEKDKVPQKIIGALLTLVGIILLKG